MFVTRTGPLKISLIAILSAFVVEFVFGLISNSLALLTDSIHALLDSVVTVILLLAARFAIKPPDAEHTYGHGKIESLGGLIGGIAIFLIACFF
ncbi:MAG: cation diffusion facilitator family transporter, partial [Candidatus Nitrosotenuis sp.]